MEESNEDVDIGELHPTLTETMEEGDTNDDLAKVPSHHHRLYLDYFSWLSTVRANEGVISLSSILKMIQTLFPQSNQDPFHPRSIFQSFKPFLFEKPGQVDYKIYFSGIFVSIQ